MKPVLDWSSYREAGMGDAYADIPARGDDFAKAVAVCINSRHCESKGKGVMCPSFRMRDDLPDLSTGGRVRLLKAALNADSDDDFVNDPRLAEAMDLCVACKGCKRECDNEVDMAMIKIEYLAQRYLQDRPPRRSRLLAALPGLLDSYPWLRTLPGWRNRSALLRNLGQKILGFSARREMPVPVAQSFAGRPENSRSEEFFPTSCPEPVGEVTLLLDTFSRQFAPANAEAAISVLNQAGYSVYVPLTIADSDKALCCGRTALAQGLVDQARDRARTMIQALLPHAEAGRSIIGLEPACLLAVRDDYRFLGLGEDAERVADRAILFEEFIAREKQAGRFANVFKAVDTGDQPLLVHGHCHQKAVGAMKSMRKVLKMIPDLKFEFIESSCCGMAGSFGMEQEHADMALAMAEQSLLPALREKPAARLLANGFSCRHQIAEGADRQAVHLAVLLKEALAES